MYQKYYTDALVLSHRELGEADRTFSLYTKDFGLLRARASAVRAEKSRMRYALQTGGRADTGLVRGARGWRVAGAVPLSGAVRGKGGIAFARIAQLVERLIAGEEENSYLFAALAEAHTAFDRASEDALGSVELICVARVLYALGYLSAEATSSALFAHALYGAEELSAAERERDTILASVNRAIAATHL